MKSLTTLPLVLMLTTVGVARINGSPVVAYFGVGADPLVRSVAGGDENIQQMRSGDTDEMIEHLIQTISVEPSEGPVPNNIKRKIRAVRVSMGLCGAAILLCFTTTIFTHFIPSLFVFAGPGVLIVLSALIGGLLISVTFLVSLSCLTSVSTKLRTFVLIVYGIGLSIYINLFLSLLLRFMFGWMVVLYGFSTYDISSAELGYSNNGVGSFNTAWSEIPFIYFQLSSPTCFFLQMAATASEKYNWILAVI